jgi:ABC-2 type transport system ATP-binding protein
MSMIVVDRVTKYYGARAAVRDLSFEIREGECVGFLGLNGAGKTTTLRMLACLLLPTTGRVKVRNLDVEENAHEIRGLIGFLPDTPPLYPEMGVAEYVAYAGKLRGMGKARVEQRLPAVLETCSLVEVAQQQIGTLSHGYKQRVGIAQAIVHEPALLILDEPIQGLDPVQIVEMREMIRGLRGRHTILLSTHILSEIEQTCDRILMMHQGRIAAEGTEDELASRFRGGLRVEMELRGGDETKVRDTLKGVEGLAGVGPEIVSAGTAEAPIWHVRADIPSDVRAAISKAMVGAGFDLVEMRSVSTGLERIFIDLSKGRGKPS